MQKPAIFSHVDYLAENAADVQRFLSEYRDVIDEAARFLKHYENTPDGQDALNEFSSYAATGIDSNEGLATTAAKLADDPDLLRLQAEGKKKSVRGLGIGASVVRALIVGGQVGAEVVSVFPYKIGTSYNVPLKVVARGWATATAGLEVASGAGLGISFWFTPPENSNNLIGVVFAVAVGGGVRVELFGWLPPIDQDQEEEEEEEEEEDPDAAAAASSLATGRVEEVGGRRAVAAFNPFKRILAFRVVLQGGLDVLAAGNLPRLGVQKVTTPLYDGSTYFLSPVNIALGVKTDLVIKVSAPMRSGAPSRIFQDAGDEKTTSFKISFPSWMADCIRNIVHVKSAGAADEAGADQTSLVGLDDWQISDTSDGQVTLDWTGADNTAWTAGQLEFNITNAVSNRGELAGQDEYSYSVVAPLLGVGQVDNPVAVGANKMTLVALVFKVSIKWTLVVDNFKAYIKDNKDQPTLDGSWAADSSLAPDQGDAFYYVLNEGDTTSAPPFVSIIDSDEVQWDMGYEFQQDPDDPSFSRIRAVMFKNGSPYNRSGNKFLASPWETVTSGQVTSTAFFEGSKNNYWAVTATMTST